MLRTLARVPLRQSFLQPATRAAPALQKDKRMHQLVPQHLLQRGRERNQALHRHADFPVIRAVDAGRQAGESVEGLIGVEQHHNRFPRRQVELVRQVAVHPVERPQDGARQSRRLGYPPLVAQQEVAAGLLPEIPGSIGLAPDSAELSFQFRIRTQSERPLPGRHRPVHLLLPVVHPALQAVALERQPRVAHHRPQVRERGVVALQLDFQCRQPQQ